MTLLKQQCAQRVARGLHPAPRLIIGQVIFFIDCFTQLCKRLIKVSLPIGNLTAQHMGCNFHKMNDFVVMQHAAVWHSGFGR